MRARLLDAAVASLHEKGYGGTTTLEVQQRAGVSRGALLHHYSSRSELLLAAMEHLTTQRLAGLVRLAQSEAPAEGRLEWAVRVLWSAFEGPLFTASLELWLAARNDAELLAALTPQERMVLQSINALARELFGPEHRDEVGFAPSVELLLDAMRGAAARAVLRPKSRDERLIAQWVAMMERGLQAPPTAGRPPGR